jgi:hypothetical protein
MDGYVDQAYLDTDFTENTGDTLGSYVDNTDLDKDFTEDTDDTTAAYVDQSYLGTDVTEDNGNTMVDQASGDDIGNYGMSVFFCSSYVC